MQKQKIKVESIAPIGVDSEKRSQVFSTCYERILNGVELKYNFEEVEGTNFSRFTGGSIKKVER